MPLVTTGRSARASTVVAVRDATGLVPEQLVNATVVPGVMCTQNRPKMLAGLLLFSVENAKLPFAETVRRALCGSCHGARRNCRYSAGHLPGGPRSIAPT